MVKKGMFFKDKKYKEYKDIKFIAYSDVELIDKKAYNIASSEKYIIFQSENLQHERGQVVVDVLFQKGREIQEKTGYSYISMDIKKDVGKLIDQAVQSAYAKTTIVGSADFVQIMDVSYKYIIKKDIDYE